MRSILTLLALLIAAPAFAQVPNHRDVVAEMADTYPAEWACAHTSRPCAEDFIKLLASKLHSLDARFGLNGKRGNPNDLSDDVVTYRAPGMSIDVRTGERVSVIDVIGAAGGPNPVPSWGEVWDPAQVPTRATWVQPAPWSGGTPTPTPPGPTPTPTPPPAPVDLGPVLAKLDALAAQVAALQAAQGEQGMSLALTLEAAQRAAHNAEQGALATLDVRNWLDAGLMVELRVPTFGGTARGAATVRRAP